MTTATKIKTTVQFGIREIKEYWRVAPYWEVIAVTAKGNCYRLGHAECDCDEDDPENRPAISKTEDFTLTYVYRMWKKCRHQWLPDERGAAGVKTWLN